MSKHSVELPSAMHYFCACMMPDVMPNTVAQDVLHSASHTDMASIELVLVLYMCLSTSSICTLNTTDKCKRLI